MSHRIGSIDLKELAPKKRGELGAVLCFIENRNESFDSELVNLEPDEPADIVYDGAPYQVRHADADFAKGAGIAVSGKGLKMFSTKSDRGSMFRDKVLSPIREKCQHYGKSASGLTLLLQAHIEYPWIEQDLKTAKSIGLVNRLRKEFKCHFDAIYFVGPAENLVIYE